MYYTDEQKAWKGAGSSNEPNYEIAKVSKNEISVNSLISSPTAKKSVQYAKATGTVQKKNKKECMGQRQFIRAKTLQNMYDVRNQCIWPWFGPKLSSNTRNDAKGKMQKTEDQGTIV